MKVSKGDTVHQAIQTLGKIWCGIQDFSGCDTVLHCVLLMSDSLGLNKDELKGVTLMEALKMVARESSYNVITIGHPNYHTAGEDCDLVMSGLSGQGADIANYAQANGISAPYYIELRGSDDPASPINYQVMSGYTLTAPYCGIAGKEGEYVSLTGNSSRVVEVGTMVASDYPFEITNLTLYACTAIVMRRPYASIHHNTLDKTSNFGGGSIYVGTVSSLAQIYSNSVSNNLSSNYGITCIDSNAGGQYDIWDNDLQGVSGANGAIVLTGTSGNRIKAAVKANRITIGTSYVTPMIYATYGDGLEVEWNTFTPSQARTANNQNLSVGASSSTSVSNSTFANNEWLNFGPYYFNITDGANGNTVSDNLV